MGRALAQLAAEREWPVVATLHRHDEVSRDTLRGAEVALEFTTPSTAPDNILACVGAGLPVVSGTTGWDEERSRVTREVLGGGGAMFWAPNFSIGVNLFWQIAERASELLARAEGFDAHIIETHHAAKKDAPSGTARELERRVSAALGRPVPTTSIRTGAVPGTHELLFDAPYEQLRVEHVARDRRVFAEGALAAARWIVGRRGVFTMRDLLDLESSPS
jgi:4-hydroxy-tetrahydrodipicolinate reductase